MEVEEKEQIWKEEEELRKLEEKKKVEIEVGQRQREKRKGSAVDKVLEAEPSQPQKRKAGNAEEGQVPKNSR